jgi:hypothetical protein
MVDRMLRAAKGKTSVVTVDNAGGYPETQAGAVEIFCGVEGLEET